MLRRRWQGLQQLDAGGQVADRFHIGRALSGLLARPLPVGNRLLGTARRGVVLSHQLWLRRDGLRELGLQHLRNALVNLLPGAPQEGLIGDLLEEGMRERVRARRDYARLVEALSRLE